MKYLKIQNNGILDIRLVALMGGTTKSKNKFLIGQFGTGLKYFLAFCFRNNIDFKIFCGTEQVIVNTVTEVINDTPFEIICINGHRTSITTSMGLDWSAWMILREVWCNALDEGGESKEITTEITACPDCTCFYIQLVPDIQKVLDEWDKYFIQDKEPLCKTDKFAIYAGGPTLKVYKHGVLIHEKKQDNMRALFSYDSLDADINELREFRGSEAQLMTHALAAANGVVAKYFLENVTDDTFEGETDLDWWCTWSKDWKDTIGEAKLIHADALRSMKERGMAIDESRYVVVTKNAYRVLTKQFEGIGALYLSQKSHEFMIHYDKKVEDRINQALTILESCEYHMHPDLVFSYGYFEDPSIKAQVNRKDKIISISNTCISDSLFEVVTTLVEENEHFVTGKNDHTREFQQHFINLYVQYLLKFNQIQI